MFRIALSSPGGEVPRLPDVPAWMANLLYARGVHTPEEARLFLHPALDQLASPSALHDMDKAAELILEAAKRGQRAVIYGDYDVDGVSASAILWESLGMLGVNREVYIPDRHREGYGLNTAAVETLAKEFSVLITVDCGIASVREVELARELGMTVIVTDHHRHGELLPPANAVVSPLLGDYPFPFLCGAGVAWKMAVRLLGGRAAPLLEIAALATVADMVPLTGENRVMVAEGLKQLARTERPGLRALMARAGVQGKVTADQVAFQIAPRMNACGRMESARTALDMLLTRDAYQAERLALKMETLNQERKTQESKVLEDALRQVAEMDLLSTKAIVVKGEGWNSGVVGLAAGRVAEKYAYPTVALAQDGDMCVGSARSAGDIDIFQALKECADLFERFGGHKQAAGLTLRAEKMPQFTLALSRAVEKQTGGKPVIPQILCDGELKLDEVTEETVRWIDALEPFGMGNPAPRFLCEGVKPLSFRAVGAEGRHLKCDLQQGNAVRGGIFFGGGEWAGRQEGSFRMAMSPMLNEFRGRVSAECRLYALELLPDSLPFAPEREERAFLSDPFSGADLPALENGQLEALMAAGQGTLLVCRCRETALGLREKFPEADFCLNGADDPRAFSMVQLYGTSGAVHAPFRHVVLCDGTAGEGEAWKRACPGAAVYALANTPAFSRLLARVFVDKDTLRRCYAALRSGAPQHLEQFSSGLFLTPGQGAFALRVFQELGLIDFSLSPFYAALRPMQKRGPEDSGLYRAAQHAKEDAYGDDGI